MSESRAHQSGSSHIAVGTNPKSKPWLTPDEQVKHLRSQGVRFDLMSEKDAISYLAKNNNFFRLRSYRQGFARVEEGKRKGQFANLDFKMLVDLSVIDMLLRYEMLRLTLDVEHFSKVMLLTHIEKCHEDGYEIIQDFLASYDHPNGSKRPIDCSKKSSVAKIALIPEILSHPFLIFVSPSGPFRKSFPLAALTTSRNSAASVSRTKHWRTTSTFCKMFAPCAMPAPTTIASSTIWEQSQAASDPMTPYLKRFLPLRQSVPVSAAPN